MTDTEREREREREREMARRSFNRRSREILSNATVDDIYVYMYSISINNLKTYSRDGSRLSIATKVSFIASEEYSPFGSTSFEKQQRT